MSKSILNIEQSVVDQQHQSLAITLCQLPCFEQLNVENIRVIAAGLSQPCFQIKTKNHGYFAKSIVNNSIEPLASQLAAAQNIAPKLFYIDEHWLITEFIVGEGLNKSNKPIEDKLAIMLMLLARCHQTSHSITNQNHASQLNSQLSPSTQQETRYIPELDISTIIEPLIKSIDMSSNQNVTLHLLLNQLLQNLTNSQSKVTLNKKVFCHGDANFSNVMQHDNNEKCSETTYKLIDFECACIAPIEYDLAMLMAVNEIPANNIAVINSLYQQALIKVLQKEKTMDIVDTLASTSPIPVGFSYRTVTCYLYLSYLINGLWYMAKYQDTKHVNYQTLALNQLKLLEVGHPQIKVLLNEMR